MLLAHNVRPARSDAWKAYRITGLFALGLLLSNLGSLAPPAAALGAVQVLEGASHHLGNPDRPEWREFTTNRAETSLTVHFVPNIVDGLQTLFIRQREVKQDWLVSLNGKPLGSLFLMEDDLIRALPVPAGLLKAGTNTLLIRPSKELDDIIVQEIRLDPRPLAEALGGSAVSIAVLEAPAKSPLPCRLTIVNDEGALVPFQLAPGETNSAIRPGVLYTMTGRANIQIAPGGYSIYASRGPEYSLGQTRLVARPGSSTNLQLTLEREMETPGYAAMDTHVHTFTFSRHGDATLEERIMTLAGEGIEIAATTDHNQIVDYNPAFTKLEGNRWFTTIPADEVTTAWGHFNAFPFKLGEAAPPFTNAVWKELSEAIRSNRSDRLIILNHPRDLHSNFRPFGPTNFNAVTGDFPRGPKGTFDAMEVINSGALQSDWMGAFQDWFALLNRGYRVTGVGASDSHDVSRFIVGQGRTYVRSTSDKVSEIRADEIVRNLREGRASVSLGLYLEIKVASKFQPGDLATNLPAEVAVNLKVRVPSWASADKLELFANGELVRSTNLFRLGGAQEMVEVEWRLPRPRQDQYLVAIASGPGVSAAYWRIPHPYQPTSLDWVPRIIAATNPVYLDGDGDAKYTSAYAYGRAIAANSPSPELFAAGLEKVDPSVIIQALDGWRDGGNELERLKPKLSNRCLALLERLQRSYPVR